MLVNFGASWHQRQAGVRWLTDICAGPFWTFFLTICEIFFSLGGRLRRLQVHFTMSCLTINPPKYFAKSTYDLTIIYVDAVFFGTFLDHIIASAVQPWH